jgi:hypothetical protein
MEFSQRAKADKPLQEAGYKRLPDGREVWVDENGDFEVSLDDPILRNTNEATPELPNYKLTLEFTGSGGLPDAVSSLSGHPALQPFTPQPEPAPAPQNPNVWSLSESLGELEPYYEPGDEILAKIVNDHLSRDPGAQENNIQESQRQITSGHDQDQAKAEGTPAYSPETGERKRRAWRTVKIISWLAIVTAVTPSAVRLASGGEAAAKACGTNPVCIVGEAWNDMNPFNYWPLENK